MTRALAVLTFVATLAFAGSPFLSSGFNGFAADQFPVPQIGAPIQPAGYAFSIWGVIYLWLIAARRSAFSPDGRRRTGARSDCRCSSVSPWAASGSPSRRHP